MREGINALAFSANWLFPGIEEGRLLTGLDTPETIARYYRDKGVALVVIKLGADGAYFDSGDEQGYVAGVPVQTVVDTVGAGDGFAAGVIRALLEGISLRPAVERGTWLGARDARVIIDRQSTRLNSST